MISPLLFKFRSGTARKNPALRWVFTLAVLCGFLLEGAHPPLSAYSMISAAPTLISIWPSQAYNDQTTTLTIFGTNFVLTPTVTLGNIPLGNVNFVNSSTLTSTIPADLPGGVYTITVTNPDSQSAGLPNAFTVLLSGDGSLTDWRTMTGMTILRDWPAAVQANNYVYVMGGGNPLFSNIYTSVERATINAGGSLGSWQTTSSMVTPRSIFAAVEANGYLYALGGLLAGGGSLSSVERAFINPDGSLKAWQGTSSVNTARLGLAAVSAYGYIYAIGGNDFTGYSLPTVERSKINSDGSLGPWEFTTSMNTPRCCLAAVVVGNSIYAIGGQGGGAASLRSVERATISADGSLSPWVVMTSMKNPRCDLAAVEVGGYIYAVGGSNCYATFYNSVERATVNADGTLSSWQILPSLLTMPRYRHPAVVRNPYIYVFGGEDDGGAVLNSVEMAAINKTVKIYLPLVK